MNRRSFLRGLAAVAGVIGVGVAKATAKEGDLEIQIVNETGRPMEAVESRRRIDGKRYVQEIILRDLRRNELIARAWRG